jgi:hypothetical protein
MWGDVTPAERLRAVTRRPVDDERLAAEAADALAGFAAEPASLVVACRRVLAHHRAHGPLWWACARLLAAAEPQVEARSVVHDLEHDATGARLGAALPLLDEGEVVAAVGWPPAVDAAVAERFDIAAVAIRVAGADPVPALRRRRSDHHVRVVDPWDPTIGRIARVLVGAAAIGPESAVVPAGTAAALASLPARSAGQWLVGGTGRVLPGRLYDMLIVAVEDLDEYEECTLQRFDRVAGPRGLERPGDAAARADCPVVPELLRALG